MEYFVIPAETSKDQEIKRGELTDNLDGLISDIRNTV